MDYIKFNQNGQRMTLNEMRQSLMQPVKDTNINRCLHGMIPTSSCALCNPKKRGDK